MKNEEEDNDFFLLKDEINNEQIHNKINLNKDKITEEELKILFQIIFNNNKLNEEKTKIKTKEDYYCLIIIINKLKNEEFISFFNYLNNNKFPILEILINGFIDFDLSKDNENQEDIILKIISKAMSINFTKNIFYFVYGKLSYFYRRHDTINNLNRLKNFEKVFKIWKLLYSIELHFKNYEDNNITNISLFPNINKDNKNILINIGQNTKIGKPNNGIDKYIITIYFESCIVLNLNKYNDKFCFIKLYDDENKCEFEIKYYDIIDDKSNNINDLCKVKKLWIELMGEVFTISINDNQINKKNAKFDFNSIKKIEILNNFIGDISTVSIEKYFTMIPNSENNEVNELIKENLLISISKTDEKIKLNLFLNGEKIENNNYIFYNGEIFSDKMNDKIIKEIKLELSDIRFLGGFESFFPLLKIINYIIKTIKNIINNNIENEIKENKNDIIDDYMSKYIIIWIKDILKIMLKMISLSEKNYIYFQRIIISLIGSLAEILHTLKDLSNI